MLAEDLSQLLNSESFTFSKEQVEYLQDEFEKQRRWVNLLSSREQAALEELERTQNSFSYRFGRFVTWFPRKVMRVLEVLDKGRIVFFISEEEEVEYRDLFPSTLLITPELLPSSDESRNVDNLVQDVLMMVKRGSLSVNFVRDIIGESADRLDDEEVYDATTKIINHLLMIKEYLPNVKNVYIGSLRALALRNSDLAIKFGNLFQDEFRDSRAIRTLIQCHGKVGNFEAPVELLAKSKKDKWYYQQWNRFAPGMSIMNNGVEIKSKKVEKYSPTKGKIFYHASQSLPHTSSGYAIRTHGLLSELKRLNIDIEGILRYGYPLDRGDFPINEIEGSDVIDEVEYIFSLKNRNSAKIIDYSEVFRFTSLEKYLNKSVDYLLEEAKKRKPSIIHSASNFVCGYAGVKAARLLGIPSIYEIRGFWHLTQSTKREGYENSDHYNVSEKLEIETAKLANHVFTITGSIKDILVENGVDESKISILPNAVDIEKFTIEKRDEELEQKLGLKDKIVIGYIGSFVEYEGLDLLIKACKMLYEEVGDVFRLLLVGDGDVFDKLRSLAEDSGLSEFVIFTGRVHHDDVQRYYSLIDIAPLPRKGFRVCELVSPLKPFEAMASGKLLITSNVKALNEIIEHGVTGLVFEKDNYQDLAEKLGSVIVDEDLRNEIAKNGNIWVKENHSWEKIAKSVTSIYEHLFERDTL
ncbi:MAG: hypothetical protein CL987_03225 [Euryarchaeota archaeon]|nr:hypothetical protein [Euryarchaeota archaeon]